MYQAVCDGCKRILENEVFEEYNGAFYTENEALGDAIERGWSRINEKLYCPDCVEYDEETKSYKHKEKEEQQ